MSHDMSIIIWMSKIELGRFEEHTASEKVCDTATIGLLTRYGPNMNE